MAEGNRGLPPISCDIFCNVIDNYGDIGVCWRLARQLANEQGVAVRLWVDDLGSFARLCSEANAELESQHCRGVEVRHWTDDVFYPLPPQHLSCEPGRGASEEPADLVIEAFACKLPEPYIAAMAAQENKPVWVNLEHLSAEDWVAGCHKLPSPHPSLPLIKYFFFPGFTPQTGGLLLERGLLARRDAFQGDARAIAAFWHSLDIPAQQADETRVSLFCYENPALPDLLAAWAESRTPVSCLAPEGRALPQVAAFFGQAHAVSGDIFRRGNLQVRVLPFVEQERYDELLWACDINFVRGEDSCVRAQWAGKPFVWHIYPQHDGVHRQKLRAFMSLYCAGLPQDAAQALHGLWEGWNGGSISGQAASFFDTSEGSGQAASTSSGQAWNDFRAHGPMLRQHAHTWTQQLSGNSLALNLLDFFRQVGKIRAS